MEWWRGAVVALCCALALVIALVATQAIRLLLAYSRHMVVKKAMARQGVSGPDYRFMVGNMFEISTFKDRATAEDLPVGCHDIVPRIVSHYWVWSQRFGQCAKLP